MPPLPRTNEEIEQIYSRHADTVYRVCYLFMKKHTQDLEDAVQTTFLKLLQCEKSFENTEHEKAWLIVTASNVCKNILGTGWRRKVKLQSEYPALPAPSMQNDETLAYVLALPDRYKTAIYLHYYEGYSGSEIARLLGKAESTVWGYLHRGRKLIKSLYEEAES